MLGHARKIATILAADVVEYSRLMGADDEGTLSALNTRRAIFDRLVREFEGREFGSVGDSLMAEFPSAVNAVRCAQAIQQAVAKENEALAPQQFMSLRIGLDLGDVLEENGALFGEGVNVAARLQSLATPGGILISGAVREHVKKKLQARLSYAGARHVKNIADPVPAYEVLAVDRQRSLLEAVAHYLHRWRIAAALALVALLAGALWYWRGALELPGHLATRTAMNAQPSVAVLPFVNMSGDPDNEYFGDGITEELLNRLAKTGQFRVTGRTSSFAFKGKNEDLRTIGQKLGVESVLEGSVRQQNDRIRITAQLIAVDTGSHLWSETYDRHMTDIFAIQDDITSRIVTALQVQLDGAAPSTASMQPVDAEVYQMVLRGRFHWNQRTPEGFTKAAALLEEATRRAPEYAPAYAALADVYLRQFDYGLVSWDDSTVRARAAATKALELDPLSAAAHTSLAHILLHEWEWPEAEQHFVRAIDLDPSYTLAQHWYALCLTALGRTDEAVNAMERALQLDPLSIRVNADLGMAYLAAGRYADAVAQEGRTLELAPGGSTPRWIRGMALEQLGRLEEAAVDMQAVLAEDPDDDAVKGSLGHVYALAGNHAEARKMLAELAAQADAKDVEFFAALICAGLKENEAAITWLERAVKERSGSVRYLKIDPRLAALRDEPGFRRLMELVRLPL